MSATRINPQMQRGYAQCPSTAANGYSDTPVTFAEPFSAINVTNTGFTVRAFNKGGGARTPGVNWLAIL